MLSGSKMGETACCYADKKDTVKREELIMKQKQRRIARLNKQKRTASSAQEKGLVCIWSNLARAMGESRVYEHRGS